MDFAHLPVLLDKHSMHSPFCAGGQKEHLVTGLCVACYIQITWEAYSFQNILVPAFIKYSLSFKIGASLILSNTVILLLSEVLLPLNIFCSTLVSVLDSNSWYWLCSLFAICTWFLVEQLILCALFLVLVSVCTFTVPFKVILTILTCMHLVFHVANL